MRVGDGHGVGIAGVEDRLDRVDGAGADVAEHDAECADHDGRAHRMRAGFGRCLHATIIARAHGGSRDISADGYNNRALSGDDGVVADDPLDTLYAARLDDFTALRTKLAAEAKRRGDTDGAKQISAARKPTTAAHVVNVLVLSVPDTRKRLTTLGERLRAAHAEMAGDRIRELTREQRRLIDELARTAFEEASLSHPTAALQDDVTGTLQAAVADPEVAARLGRLSKAEQWSGFGEFGDTAIVFKPTRSRKSEPQPQPEPKKPGEDGSRDDKREARAALAAAERAKAEADDALSELQSDLATARLRRDDAGRRLQEAERALHAAEDAYDKGKQASRDAASVVKHAKARLK